MAESAEHDFLKNKANQVLADFSNLKLYGFTETDRKKFDFSCLLERDWSRPLVGQVLWKHVEGIEKDIRTLVTEKESEIKLYVARDSIQARQQFEETIGEFRKSGRFPDLFRFKSIWIPQDFDADKEKQQTLVGQILTEAIVEDILFNVVFGNLTAQNIRFFLDATGVQGLNLALLYIISTDEDPHHNITSLAQRVEMSSGPVREKLMLLKGAGFISNPIGAILYRTTLRGRVFLDLARRLFIELQTPVLSEELKYILRKLDCNIVPLEEIVANTEIFPESMYVALVQTIFEATRKWDVDFLNMKHANVSLHDGT